MDTKEPPPHDTPTVPVEVDAAVATPNAAAGLWLAVVGVEGTVKVPLDAGLTVLGRGLKSIVPLQGDDISREHASLTLTPHSARVLLEDLGSVNGTHVNGERLAPGKPVVLEVGGVFRLGVSTLCMLTDCGAPGLQRASEGPRCGVDSMDDVVERVAQSNLSVIIQGETGAGKEYLARRIHALSPRTERALISINCAAIPESLLESELFGFVRGAFSGANKDKIGLFQAADSGTLLLDEIAEMQPALQAKLLQALESREIRPVGSTTTRRVDVRVLSATHAPLQAAVERGVFRQDLYFRLNGITIRVPPLRERRGEIPRLARRFAAEGSKRLGLERASSLTAEAIERLCHHSWPGNVRELRNAIERAIVLAPHQNVTPEHIIFDDVGDTSVAHEVGHGSPTPHGSEHDLQRETVGVAAGAGVQDAQPALREVLQATERDRILAALHAANFNQSRAAKQLGIARGTLRKRIRQFGITLPRP